jgi:hypothetical protein
MVAMVLGQCLYFCHAQVSLDGMVAIMVDDSVMTGSQAFELVETRWNLGSIWGHANVYGKTSRLNLE